MGSHFLFHWYLKSFNLIEKQQQNLNNRLTVCLCSLAAEQQQRVYVYRHHTGVSKVPTLNRHLIASGGILKYFLIVCRTSPNPHVDISKRNGHRKSWKGRGMIGAPIFFATPLLFLLLSARNFKSCTISKSVVDQSQRLVQKYLRITCFIHFKYRSC